MNLQELLLKFHHHGELDSFTFESEHPEILYKNSDVKQMMELYSISEQINLLKELKSKIKKSDVDFLMLLESKLLDLQTKLDAIY